jgi:hypothetical protein
MADQDLFEEETGKNPAEGEVTPNPDANTDDANTVDQLLASIVNENGEQKYSTPEDALKGAAHAQKHIKAIESELAELKNKGNASDKLDELLEAVKSKGSGKDDETNVSAMKPEDVLGIVKDYFSDAKAAETRENNISTVTKVFRDRYGKDASENLYTKANDLGFSKEEINSMIANNPNAALKVLGEAAPKTPKGKDPVTSLGSVDTSQFQGHPNQKPKSIMGPTKTGELNDAWAASKKKTLERLGFDV